MNDKRRSRNLILIAAILGLMLALTWVISPVASALQDHPIYIPLVANGERAVGPTPTLIGPTPSATTIFPKPTPGSSLDLPPLAAP